VRRYLKCLQQKHFRLNAHTPPRHDDCTSAGSAP
jgi:hypothetical protein